MKTHPEFSVFSEKAPYYKVMPVYRHFRVDFETPISLFKKLKAQFLLESVEHNGSIGRYSIIGLGKVLSIRLNAQTIHVQHFRSNALYHEENLEAANPLEKVREVFRQFTAPDDLPDLPPFFGGAIGYLGHETVQYFEKIPVHEHGPQVPDGLMVVPQSLLVYDNIHRECTLIQLALIDSHNSEMLSSLYQESTRQLDKLQADIRQALPLEVIDSDEQHASELNVQLEVEKEDFLAKVEQCKEYIKSGEIIQVVLSQPFTIETKAEPFELYRTLRILNPSPYLYFLEFDDFQIIGSSPEVMVRVQNNQLLLKPIAGTRPRGQNEEQDVALEKDLLEDPKERAEHLMLVDLGRNDLGRVAKTGSVKVHDYMSVERYSHVMHIVSSVEAELDERYDAFDVLKAVFPAGTLSGAPKIRALEIISELEECRRGPYGGLIFNLGFNGHFDSCITIRTLLLQDGKARIQAGAGIVADSVPENEYKETINKAKALVRAVKTTPQGDKA